MGKTNTLSNRFDGPQDKPFSILIAGISWPPETFIATLIKGLIDAGAAITVACEQKPTAPWLPHPQFSWIFAPTTWRGSLLARLGRTIRMIPRALVKGSGDLRLIQDHVDQRRSLSGKLSAYHELLPFAGVRSDVIYFPWNSGAISYLPLFDLGPPVILSCRGSQVNIAPLSPQRSSMKGDLGTTFRKATAVHCVSEAIMYEAERYGLERAKAKVIRPAVDPQFFQPLEAPVEEARDGLFRIATIGTLIWSKGYEYALQAIRELKDSGINVQFSILGDGPDRQRILYTVNDLELNKEVELHGRNSPEEVRAILQRSDAFLLTSFSEGISNAVLEAMACGIPVVTTDCGGMREAVTDGVEGFVVPTRDTTEMVRTLKVLWDHPEQRSRMGRAGRQRIERTFSLSRQVDEFISLCKTVAAASQPIGN
jgi:colanic acid/amylovoran biosynthesis glycosyltransferase